MDGVGGKGKGKGKRGKGGKGKGGKGGYKARGGGKKGHGHPSKSGAKPTTGPRGARSPPPPTVPRFSPAAIKLAAFDYDPLDSDGEPAAGAARGGGPTSAPPPAPVPIPAPDAAFEFFEEDEDGDDVPAPGVMGAACVDGSTLQMPVIPIGVDDGHDGGAVGDSDAAAPPPQRVRRSQITYPRDISLRPAWNVLHDVNSDEAQTMGAERFIAAVDFGDGPRVLALPAGIASKLQPHQTNGVRAAWQALYRRGGGVYNEVPPRTAVGDACGPMVPHGGMILAHEMGTGKTFTCVALLALFHLAKRQHNVLSLLGTALLGHSLLVLPSYVISSWALEWRRWLQYTGLLDAFNVTERLPYTERHSHTPGLYHYRSGDGRAFQSWLRSGGCFVISYNAFVHLVNSDNQERRRMRDALLTTTELVVLDEGHGRLGAGTATRRALDGLRTLGRIVVTGTPMQNDVGELYDLMQFVKPGFMDLPYYQRLSHVVLKGRNPDYPGQTKESQKASFVLRQHLRPVLNRRDCRRLLNSLPARTDLILTLPLSPRQLTLYSAISRWCVTCDRNVPFMVIFTALTKLVNDPAITTATRRSVWQVLQAAGHPQPQRPTTDTPPPGNAAPASGVKRQRMVIDDMSDDAAGPRSLASSTTRKRKRSAFDAPATTADSACAGADDSDGDITDAEDDEAVLQRSQKILWELQKYLGDVEAKVVDVDADAVGDEGELSDGDEPSWQIPCTGHDVAAAFAASVGPETRSAKHAVTAEIIRGAIANNETVLVFSSWIQTLVALQQGVERILPDMRALTLTGEMTAARRAAALRDAEPLGLDAPAKVDAIFCTLATCGTGLNIQFASVVVFTDCSWNPARTEQAVARSWRLGQKRPVTVYRLVARGTFEEDVTKNALGKTWMQRCLVKGASDKAQGFEYTGLSVAEATECVRLNAPAHQREVMRARVVSEGNAVLATLLSKKLVVTAMHAVQFFSDTDPLTPDEKKSALEHAQPRAGKGYGLPRLLPCDDAALTTLSDEEDAALEKQSAIIAADVAAAAARLGIATATTQAPSHTTDTDGTAASLAALQVVVAGSVQQTSETPPTADPAAASRPPSDSGRMGLERCAAEDGGGLPRATGEEGAAASASTGTAATAAADRSGGMVMKAAAAGGRKRRARRVIDNSDADSDSGAAALRDVAAAQPSGGDAAAPASENSVPSGYLGIGRTSVEATARAKAKVTAGGDDDDGIFGTGAFDPHRKKAVPAMRDLGVGEDVQPGPACPALPVPGDNTVAVELAVPSQASAESTALFAGTATAAGDRAAVKTVVKEAGAAKAAEWKVIKDVEGCLVGKEGDADMETLKPTELHAAASSASASASTHTAGFQQLEPNRAVAEGAVWQRERRHVVRMFDVLREEIEREELTGRDAIEQAMYEVRWAEAARQREHAERERPTVTLLKACIAEGFQIAQLQAREWAAMLDEFYRSRCSVAARGAMVAKQRKKVKPLTSRARAAPLDLPKVQPNCFARMYTREQITSIRDAAVRALVKSAGLGAPTKDGDPK